MRSGKERKRWWQMTDLLQPGEPALDFELKDVQGRLVRLSDLRGGAVVLALLRGFM